MRIAVLGLWHLGSVTASGAARAGHDVTGWDRSEEAVLSLSRGVPPLFEPGLEEQIKDGIAQGRLRFTADLEEAVKGKQIVWIASDTPVDENDHADPESVLRDVRKAAVLMDRGALILLSSQLPAGSAKSLGNFLETSGRGDLEVACSPENLRLGQALEVFSNPDRIVCGVPSDRAKGLLKDLFHYAEDRILWMSVPSAEMTKHAINAFLALSVSFANEIASLCEFTGADAKEVERGLKSEKRIGPGAYLGPGPAFAGGTLARDLAFLSGLGQSAKRKLPVVEAARLSNDLHKNWVTDRLEELLGALKGRRIALWGLAYKPGTDTLRRSQSLETAAKLAAAGASVTASDPLVRELPSKWRDVIELCESAPDSVREADALVVCTPWPEYLGADKGELLSLMRRPVAVDPSGFLRPLLGDDPDWTYACVGYARRGP